MKAIVYTKYGSPDVLQLKDIAKPTPAQHDVLIKIHAAVVGPSDCTFRLGSPFFSRIATGFMKPKNPTPGVEFAGEIEAVGSAVTSFKAGDPVYGMSPKTFGAHAEYLCLPEDGVLAIRPSNTTYAEAVAICDGATTALTFLRDKAGVQSGQKVLINGASGSVGAYAVQVAISYGAEVTGVCSTANVERVQSLGAEHVIDYTHEDFARNGQTYDVIFDAVGKDSFSHSKGALTATGIYLSTVPTPALLLQMVLTSRGDGRKAKFATAGLEQTKAHLDSLRTLVEAGKIKAVIDRYYPLEQIADAHRYVETGHKKGNVVINVAQEIA